MKHIMVKYQGNCLSKRVYYWLLQRTNKVLKKKKKPRGLHPLGLNQHYRLGFG